MIESAEIMQKNMTGKSIISSAVAKAARGDKEAFSQLVKGMENRLYRVSRSVLRNDADCADAIQEALIRAWLNLPELRSHHLFEHWLIRIVLRECYRIAKVKQHESLDLMDNAAEYKTNADDKIAIQNAVYSLDIKKRVPFVLHYIEGYKLHEIADMLGISENTVKTRLMRARGEMREELKEDK